MTEPIVIRTVEDLDAVIPSLVAYRPVEGSIVLMEATAQPVAILGPDVLANYFDDFAQACYDLSVFGGRQVVVFLVGQVGPNNIQGVLDFNRSAVVVERRVEASLFEGLPTRAEFLAGRRDFFDQGFERAEEVAAGLADRYDSTDTRGKVPTREA